MNATETPPGPLQGRAWWLSCLFVFALSLVTLAPTTGDIGLTWDEPSYRYSQLMSEPWWKGLLKARSVDDLSALLSPDALLYHWPYGRFGINFHPPLAGQLNLLTYELFGGFMKDIPARRMSSVIEFALTVTALFGFLASRYGRWVGIVAAGSLLLMPRLYGDAHIAGTDIPGLMLWAFTVLAFWKGLHAEGARGWRVAVGVLLGLAFVEKMAAVMVILPLMAWLVFGHLTKAFRRGSRGDWIDGLVTSTLMLIPLALTLREIRRLAHEFLVIQLALDYPADKLSPANTNLFRDHPVAQLPAWILAVPLVVWIARRLAGRFAKRSQIWGVERPALEIWTAILAFAPVVSWMGNPAWWRETLPRLAHYYGISSQRRGVLPDIQILYFGQTYEYSLPWENAWVFIAVTVPAGILIASLVGLVLKLPSIRRDRLPLFFLINLAILPALRMLETPAHDGVRLFLPTFFFIAAFAGWGVDGLARMLSRRRKVEPAAEADGTEVIPSRRRLPRVSFPHLILAGLVLGSAAVQLVRVHPFELSYYNELIGGVRGASKAGFELSYWYEAFDNDTLAQINRLVPDGAAFAPLNPMTEPPTFSTLQELGALKGSLRLGTPDKNAFPYVWILTQDSKATSLTRLIFAMEPFYERRPRQLDDLRVVTVASPETVSRAWALQLLCDVTPSDLPPLPPDPPRAPAIVRQLLPPLARFWGDGLTKSKPLRVNPAIFEWVESDPGGLRAAAEELLEAGQKAPDPTTPAGRLHAIITHQGRWLSFYQTLLRARPEALREAIDILIRRGDDVKAVLTRYQYTDPSTIGGPLDW